MAGVDVASIGLKVDTSDLKSAPGDLERFGSASKKMGEDTEGAQEKLDKLGEVAREVKEKIMELAAVLGVGIGIEKIVEGTAEASITMAVLQARLNATGDAAGISAKQMRAWAEDMSASTTFSTESLIKMQATMLTFPKISGETFERVRKDAINMAQAMGEDASSAAFTLGRALEMPANSMRLLRQAGIDLTVAQQQQLKLWGETGNTAAAAELILGKLEGRFNTVAAAAGSTFGGALEQTKHAFEDLFKFEDNKGFEALTKSLQSLNIELRSPAAKDAANNFGTVLGGALSVAADAVKQVVIVFEKFNAITISAGGYTETLGSVISGLANVLSATLMFVLNGVSNILQRVIIDFQALGNIIADVATRNWDKLHSDWDKWNAKLAQNSAEMDVLGAKWVSASAGAILGMTKTGDAHDKAAEAAEKHRKALEDLIAATQKQKDELIKLEDALDPVRKAWNDYNAGLKILDDSLKLHLLTQAEYSGWLQKLKDQRDLDIEQGDRKNHQVDEEIRKLEMETKALSYELQGRKDLSDALKIEYDLRDKILHISDEDVARIKAATAARDEEKDAVEAHKKALEQQASEAKRVYNEELKLAQETGTQIVDAFFNMAEGSQKPFQNLLNYFKHMLEQMIAAVILNPIIIPIIMDTIGSFGGAGGVAGGGAAGILGQAGNAASIANLAGGKTLFSGVGASISNSINAFGSSLGFAAAPVGSYTGLAASADGLGSMSFAGPGSSSLFGGTTLTGALGALGIGALAGGMLSSLWGGNQTYGSIGGGVGALAGLELAPLLGVSGPLGAIVGGLIGSLASLFGKKSDSAEYGALDPLTGQTFSGGNTKHPSQANTDAANSAISQIASFVTQLQQTTGGHLDLTGTSATVAGSTFQGKIALEVGSRDGINAVVGSATQSFSKGQEEQATKWIIQQVVEQMKGMPADVETAIKKIDWTGDIQKNLSLIQFAADFQKNIKAMTDGTLSIQNDAYVAAASQVQTYVTQIQTFKATTAQLGLNTQQAADATKSFVEQLVGLKNAKPETDAQKAVDTIKGTFSAIGPLLDEVGIGADKAAGLLASALQKLSQAYNLSIASQIEQISNPQQFALDQVNAWYTAALADAETYGADLSQVDQLYYLKRQQVIDQYNQQAISAQQATTNTQLSLMTQAESAWKSAADSITKAIDAIKLNPQLSTLSPLQQRDEAFTQLFAGANAAKTDPAAAGNLGNLANAALTASRAVYASSDRYSQDYATVMSILSVAQSGAAIQVNYASQQVSLLQGILDALTKSGNTMVAPVVTAPSSASDWANLNKNFSAAFSSSGQSISQFGGGTTFQGFEHQFMDLTSQSTDVDFLKSQANYFANNKASFLAQGWSQATYDEQYGTTKARLHQLGVPGFAGGGSNIGGLSVVGEGGPELLNIPRGSSVTSNSDAKSMFGQSNKDSLMRQDVLIDVTSVGFGSLRKDIQNLKTEMEKVSRTISSLRHA